MTGRNKANAKSHTHCQVAQKASYTSQNLSKSMPLPTLSAERKIKPRQLTKAIPNKGFSGKLKVNSSNEN